MAKKTEQTTTDFGDQQIPFAEKTQQVQSIFTQVADQYDLMNQLMSFGLHQHWKATAIDLTWIKPGNTVLDLASGSGDLVPLIRKKQKNQGQVIAGDLNLSMLNTARDKLLNQGLSQEISYCQLNAEALPFANDHIDIITMAFGIRNVTDKTSALEEIYRVLKPGGQAMILEFSEPKAQSVKCIYDWYSHQVIPQMGHWVADNKAAYQYLVESIRKHPNQEAFSALLEQAKFQHITCHNLLSGVIAIHRACKP